MNTNSDILSVIIPVFNEEATIETLLYEVAGVELIKGMSKQIIIVDDCSEDGTSAGIKSFTDRYPEADIVLHRHDRNQGKGAAIRTALASVSGKYVIIQDADLEYVPAEYNLLLEPVASGKADVVYGSRFIGDKPHRVLYFWHWTGNKVITFLSNLFTNINLSDVESCYKLFRTDILQQVTIVEDRFGFEPEITAKISRIKGIRIFEVGISYYGRTYDEGKKINWKDGFRALYCILKYGAFKM